MRAGLIGQYVRNDPALHHFWQHISAIANESDGNRLSILPCAIDQLERFIERPRNLVAVTALQSFLDAHRIDIYAKKKRAVHGGSERLSAAHPAKTTAQHKFSLERAVEMFAPSGRKSFE